MDGDLRQTVTVEEEIDNGTVQLVLQIIEVVAFLATDPSSTLHQLTLFERDTSDHCKHHKKKRTVEVDGQYADETLVIEVAVPIHGNKDKPDFIAYSAKD